jgi:hypothetical protein
MLMSKKVLLALVALAASVYAQDTSSAETTLTETTVDTSSAGTETAGTETASSAAPTSTDSIPPCVLQCSMQAATSAGCQGVYVLRFFFSRTLGS